jgi:hypothetical protein
MSKQKYLPRDPHDGGSRYDAVYGPRID